MRRLEKQAANKGKVCHCCLYEWKKTAENLWLISLIPVVGVVLTVLGVIVTLGNGLLLLGRHTLGWPGRGTALKTQVHWPGNYPAFILC
ncbi:MAG TPA: hypothetical protein GXX25_05660 [Desulfotomaculum sp.]|nr:hypothetical protein [Desulfotomaculum sp.]